MQFTVDRALLSKNKLERREFLDNYFPAGLVPYEELECGQWVITPFSPQDAEAYVDPQLEVTLREWPGEPDLKKIGLWRAKYKNAMVSFFDSWSLYYWSLLFSYLKEEDYRRVTLLHVDDHTDLEAPLIKKTPGGYESLLSRKRVMISDPNSIMKAVQECSIGIDSFIAPLFHCIEAVDIRHLRYAHLGDRVDTTLQPTELKDSLLAYGQVRPAVDRVRGEGSHHYCLSADPVELLSDVDRNSLLLFHLDLDALCNRYNMDSNWSSARASIDLKMGAIKAKLDQLIEQVTSMGMRTYVNVALSPGFFPSEFWMEILSHTFVQLEVHDLIQEDSFSEYLSENGLWNPFSLPAKAGTLQPNLFV